LHASVACKFFIACKFCMQVFYFILLVRRALFRNNDPVISIAVSNTHCSQPVLHKLITFGTQFFGLHTSDTVIKNSVGNNICATDRQTDRRMDRCMAMLSGGASYRQDLIRSGPTLSLYHSAPVSQKSKTKIILVQIVSIFK